ncbi:MAG TPA: hypothetical protein VGB37_08625 [Candidatus Lokiarchaeia archaeon]
METVARGEIKFITENQTVEHQFEIPAELAKEVLIKIIDWKNQIMMSPADYEKFLDKTKK